MLNFYYHGFIICTKKTQKVNQIISNWEKNGKFLKIHYLPSKVANKAASEPGASTDKKCTWPGGQMRTDAKGSAKQTGNSERWALRQPLPAQPTTRHWLEMLVTEELSRMQTDICRNRSLKRSSNKLRIHLRGVRNRTKDPQVRPKINFTST